MVSELKDQGDKEFAQGNYIEAVEHFTKAIELESNNYIFFSSRSACYLSLDDYHQALEDANKCISLKPDETKGYISKFLAQFYQGNYKEAIETCIVGLNLDPNSQQLKENLERAQLKLKESATSLDSQTVEIFDEINTQRSQARPKKHENKDRARFEQEAYPEHKEKNLKSETLAEGFKELGNIEYKKKEWLKALEYYDNAFKLNSKEIAYINKKAAVYYAMKEYQKCIEVCDEAVDRAKEVKCESIKLARVYSRKVRALQKLGDLDGAITLIKVLLMECEDNKLRLKLSELKDLKKARDQEVYNNLVKTYSKAINLNPKCAKYYSERSACYLKLLDYTAALNDVDKVLELKPNFVMALIRKASIHTDMKEFHKALDTYEKILSLKPSNSEAQEGYQRARMSIGLYQPDYERYIELKVEDKSTVEGHWLRKIAYRLCNLVTAIKINNYKQKSILLSLSNDFKEHFDKAFTSFYNCSVKTESFNCIDGLIVGLRNIVRTLLYNEIIYQKFCICIKEFHHDITDYIQEFFEQIQHQSRLSQIFYITCLIIMKISSNYEWEFLFLSQKHLDKKFIAFNSQTNMKEGFMELASRKIILNTLNQFNCSNTPTLEMITQLLHHTYLTETSLSVSGLTSYNLFIFINADLQKLESRNESKLNNAIIYIILIHELANALRRTMAKTLAESRKMLTPSESHETSFVFDENDAEQQWTQIRGETGFQAEKLIFGKKVKEITLEAAAYLFDYSDDVTHEEFKRKFAELQKVGPASPLRRESTKVRIGRCMFSGLE